MTVKLFVRGQPTFEAVSDAMCVVSAVSRARHAFPAVASKKGKRGTVGRPILGGHTAISDACSVCSSSIVACGCPF